MLFCYEMLYKKVVLKNLRKSTVLQKKVPVPQFILKDSFAHLLSG